jgi:hypothetical protein
MKKIDGLTVSNAAMPIRLNVTAADIKKGAPKNPNSCAIALAAVRQIKGATAARVHLSCVYVMIRGEWRRYRTPEYATREIVAFDRGGTFIPGEYDLLPVPTGALIKRIRGEAPTRKRSSTKRRPRHVTLDVRESAHANEPPASKEKSSAKS